MSTLKVDNLSSVDGNSTVLTGGNYRPGEIIETIGGPCDGRTVTGISGSYTLQNVTSPQLLTTTYTDVTGSSITYTPPVGTNYVHYEFCFQMGAQDGTDTISHSKFYVDGAEVVYARYNCGPYRGAITSFNWSIECNASTADTNTGRLTSWTTPKVLKIKGRSYTSSFDSYYHNVRYWDGSANTGQLTMPVLIIKAIA
jgi:hypothetical protein